MATAVFDVEFENLPTEIKVSEKYSRALVLVRFKGYPVSQCLIPVIEGQVGGENILEAILTSVNGIFWEHWLQNYFQLEEPKALIRTQLKATIAICTRDRTEYLKRCLESLLNLHDDGQEYLVIDNCPTNDSTRAMVQKFDRIRYVHETRPGLNIARNRALREAHNDIVAFTDDDAEVDPNWLRALLNNFEDPSVMCVTGLTMPKELEDVSQEWFEQMSPFQRGFRRVVIEWPTLNPLHSFHVGSGVNMALRRNVLEKIGLFDESLDTGTPTLSGGDTDLFSRILAGGYRIIYDPRALNWHLHRNSWNTLRKTLFGYGLGVSAALTRRFVVDGEYEVPNLYLRILWGKLRNFVSSIRNKDEHSPSDLKLAEIVGFLIGPWAYCYSRIKLKTRIDRSNDR
jgi:glycosyltransferase involved in cell wall biosynthesis